MTKIHNKAEIFGWSMFDFANSSYTTIIITVVYSVFFTKVIAGSGPHAELWWGLAMMASEGLVVLSAPVIGAMADATGSKKRWLAVTFVACVVATALLGLAQPGWVVWAWGWFVVSNWAYSLGENLNSSFLPELTPPETMGRVSGFAWAVGYVGGLASLALCYPFVKDGLTLANEANVRMTAWVTAGFFFLGGMPMFLMVQERPRKRPILTGERGAILRVGVDRVRSTLGHIHAHERLAKFFPVYGLYMAGLSIVIAFSAVFAEKTLGFGPKELMGLFIVLQISACLGALGFGFLQDRIGPRRTIILTVGLWMVVVAAAALCQSQALFLAVANVAGLCLGATASASRTYVGLLVPEDRSAECYGFMGLFSKLASGVGALSFGVGVSVLGGQRAAMAVPFMFFLLGFIGMVRLDKVGRETVAD